MSRGMMVILLAWKAHRLQSWKRPIAKASVPSCNTGAVLSTGVSALAADFASCGLDEGALPLQVRCGKDVGRERT